MNAAIRKVIVFLLALLPSMFPIPAFCAAEQRAIRLVDISGSESPLRLSGTITFRYDPTGTFKYSYQVTANAKNVSAKPILLMVIHFLANGGIGPGYDFTSTQDYFLRSQTLGSGTTVNIEASPFRFGTPIANGKPEIEHDSRRLKRATAQVEFIQFEDGSTWGDSQIGASEIEHRVDTQRHLAKLEQIYKDDGKQAFLNELAEPTDLACIEELKNACKDQPDYFSCTHDAIARLTRNAK